MNCPKCGGIPYISKNPRAVDGKSYRKFTCRYCKHEYYTVEQEITLDEFETQLMKYQKNEKKKTAKQVWVKVRCIDTGEVFDSMSKAAKSVPITRSAIWMCCNGKRETAADLRWEYYNEDEKENEV